MTAGLENRTQSSPGRRDPAGARMIAVGGGKGGVGKSFLVVNLAAALARRGHRVLVVDGDLEGANLHTCLGVPPPLTSLADFVAQREEDLVKLVVDTPFPNLQLIAATNTNLATAHPNHSRRIRLVRQLRHLSADFVFLDLGAGTDSTVMDYFLIGDDGIVVMAPEPTSVENAYSFLRAAFYRRLRLAMVSHGIRQVVTQAMDLRNERGIRTPHDLLREIQALDPDEGSRFVATVRTFRPRIVVNAVRSADDIKLGFAARSVCRKYFGIDAEYLGYVSWDEAARQSVVARRPLVEVYPRCEAARYIGRIAQKLAGVTHRPPPGSAPSLRYPTTELR